MDKVGNIDHPDATARLNMAYRDIQSQSVIHQMTGPAQKRKPRVMPRLAN